MENKKTEGWVSDCQTFEQLRDRLEKAFEYIVTHFNELESKVNDLTRKPDDQQRNQ